MTTKWACEDCGWPWPLEDAPPPGAECDVCGGELEYDLSEDDPDALSDYLSQPEP